MDTLASVEDADISRLGDALGGYPLDVAVLFGSAASGETTELSDLDVGVKFQEDVSAEERISFMDEITAEVIGEAGFSAVDLVDLERVPAAVAYRALDTGKVLVGDEADVTRIKERFLREKLDFQPVKQQWKEALSQRVAGVQRG